MATLMERIEASFTTLDEMVSKAESAKQESQAIRDFAAKLGSVVRFVDGLDGENASKLVEVIGKEPELGTVWVSTISNLRTIVESVSKASGLDRQAGDESVKALRTLAGAPLFAFDDTPELKARAEDLIARWETSAPTKSTRGEGSGTPVPELGFTVACSCQETGCNWRATTTKDNRNSFWRQASLHMRDVHKVLDNSAKGKLGQGVIEAMTKVMSGESHTEQGGQFVISKSGA